jgi:hypothetical protein
MGEYRLRVKADVEASKDLFISYAGRLTRVSWFLHWVSFVGGSSWVICRTKSFYPFLLDEDWRIVLTKPDSGSGNQELKCLNRR